MKWNTHTHKHTHALTHSPTHTHAGISAHQKLDLLSELVCLLGFESVTVFGDCFDEVTLLDPVRFPGAIRDE